MELPGVMPPMLSNPLPQATACTGRLSSNVVCHLMAWAKCDRTCACRKREKN